MSSESKIGLIVVYYGKWPEWTPYFLKSCSRNENIRWFIFSDIPPAENVPSNVSYINFPLDSFRTRVKSLLGITPDIIHPYKLTDFKPAYGHIFHDYLEEYTHWGYCDIDIIFGSITRFIDEQVLTGFDIISPSPDFFPGHFLILTNNEMMTNLFKNAANWKEIFVSEKYHCFDEHLLRKGITPDNESIFRQVSTKARNHILEYKAIRNPFTRFLKKIVPIKSRSPIAGNQNDFNQVLKNKSLSGEIKTFRKLLFSDDIIHRIKGDRQININWTSGSLFDGNKEIMYYHFQLAKYEDSLRITQNGPDQFNLSARL